LVGAGDAAWAVAADRDSVFVLGEIGDAGHDFTGMLLRSYDARTGAIRWEQELPGARNFTYKNTLVTDGRRVFVAGTDAKLDFLVRAYDARSGALSWVDSIDDGDRAGGAGALVLGTDGHGRDRLFATGVMGCNPADFLDCTLAVRAYDPRTGLVWHRAEEAEGGDWYPGYTAAASGGRVFVTAGERLADGQYHATVRAYESRDGDLVWAEPFDPGNDPPGFCDVSVVRNRLFVGGSINGPGGSSDSVLRAYRANEHVDEDEPDVDDVE
jgi:outer membrane protein assembly factor BamB